MRSDLRKVFWFERDSRQHRFLTSPWVRLSWVVLLGLAGTGELDPAETRPGLGAVLVVVAVQVVWTLVATALGVVKEGHAGLTLSLSLGLLVVLVGLQAENAPMFSIGACWFGLMYLAPDPVPSPWLESVLKASSPSPVDEEGKPL